MSLQSVLTPTFMRLSNASSEGISEGVDIEFLWYSGHDKGNLLVRPWMLQALQGVFIFSSLYHKPAHEASLCYFHLLSVDLKNGKEVQRDTIR
jgi:hypothetical protein